MFNREKRYKKESEFKQRLVETYDKKLDYIKKVISSCETYDQINIVEAWAYNLEGQWHAFEMSRANLRMFDFITAYFCGLITEIYNALREKVNEVFETELSKPPKIRW